MLHILHPKGVYCGQLSPSCDIFRGKAVLRRNAIITRSASDRASAVDFVTFTLIVDDLVFWDGTTQMGQLGGGGAQTAWGYQSFYGGERHIAVAAGVGPDLPPSCLEWFKKHNIDTCGIVEHPDVETPRAWQILEQDGRRHEIWRTEQSPHQASLLLPPFTTLSSSLQAARAFHLGVHPEHPPWDLLYSLRNALDQHGGLLSIETFTKASKAVVHDKKFAELMQLSDIFSPNEEEACSMLFESTEKAKLEHPGQQHPLELTAPFIEMGAKWVTLRRGPRGALVHQRQGNKAWDVPAVPGTKVVDTTGCGNAFCGAFLAALQAGADGGEAGAAGCAAGSLVAEVKGIPDELGLVGATAEVRRRAARLNPRSVC